MSTQIAEYSATVAGLADLKAKLANVVYDVTKAEGMDKARKDRRWCVTLRTDLEALRVKIKAPALERCRLIDAEAKAITAEIMALESPIDAQIKAEEGRKERERLEREAAEKARIAAIEARIAGINGYVTAAIGKGAAKIAALIEDVNATVVDEAGYQEFTHLGAQAKADTLAKLREMYEAAVANEEEAERLMAERLELDRVRKEQEAAAAKEREAIAKLEQEAKAKLEAEAIKERARLDEEARIARAARELADAKARSERDEQDRIAREARAEEEKTLRAKQAEIARQQEELRRARDPLTALKAIHAIVDDDFLSDTEARFQIRKVCNRALETA